MVEFEIKARDLGGRIGLMKTPHGEIETPTIFPVINPNQQIIKAGEMEKFGAQGVITNSYLLWKNHQEQVLAQGVHNFLQYSGPVMTDSGAFQLMEYGDIDVSNEQIIDFQKRIGVDIGVILDIPSKTTYKKAVEKNVEETIQRAKEAEELIDNKRLWCGPIQGGVHSDLVIKASREMSKLNFDIHPIGSVVPLLVNYKFAELIEIMRNAKQNLPENRPVHLFGAGHPMFFAFAVAMGVDLFDSAAYILYAKDKRYLTQTGTLHLDEMTHLPCSCPACAGKKPSDLTFKDLAEHNLYVTFNEINLIKENIKQGTLFELIEQRAAAHPELYKAMKSFTSQANLKYLSKKDKLTKSHFFISTEFSTKQPLIERVEKMLSRVPLKEYYLHEVFGRVPKNILECYPFSHSTTGDLKYPKTKNNYEKIKDVSLYWFGVNIFDEECKIRVSPKTHKIREVHKNGKLLATFRATDFKILLHAGAELLFEKTKGMQFRVKVKNEASDFIREGRSVFAKHVVDADDSIIPGQEVLVINEEGELLASGEAILNKKEMIDFERGVAVKPRWKNKKKE